MKTENLNSNEGKVSVRISKNNWMHISKGGRSISVPVNLVKHVLSIPFTRKDGVYKSVQEIKQDHVSSQNLFKARILKLAAIRSAQEAKDFLN